MKKENNKKTQFTAAAGAAAIATAAAATTVLSGNDNDTATATNDGEELADGISTHPHIGGEQENVQPEMFADNDQSQSAQPDLTAQVTNKIEPSVVHAARPHQEMPLVEELTESVNDDDILLAQEVTPITTDNDALSFGEEQLIGDTSEPLASVAQPSHDVDEEFGGDFIDENDNTAIDATSGYSTLRSADDTNDMPLTEDSSNDIMQDIHNLL